MKTNVLALLLSAICFSDLQALSIKEAGQATGADVKSWRTSSVHKHLDGDHDNTYGTLGYVVFAPMGADDPVINQPCLENRFFSPYDDMRSLPEAISIEPVAGIRQNFKYAEIDNPVKPGTLRCGSLSAVDNEQSEFASGNANILKLAFSKPGKYRIGFLVDHMESQKFTADAYGLWNANTGATSIPIIRDGTPKFVFFDVTVSKADITSFDNTCCFFASFLAEGGMATVGAVAIDELK